MIEGVIAATDGNKGIDLFHETRSTEVNFYESNFSLYANYYMTKG